MQLLQSLFIESGSICSKTSHSTFQRNSKDADQNKYKRYIGTSSLFALKNLLMTQQLEEGKANEKAIEDISKAINSIKASEKDRELIERYSEF